MQRSRYRSPFHFLVSVILRHWMLKGVGTTAFMTLFFIAYVHLLKNPAFPVTVMPFTWVDAWVGFQPWTLPVYLSLWLYVSIPPSLLVRREDLFLYGWAIGAVCGMGLVCFYFWPTMVPPTHIDWAQYPAVAFLKGMDAAGNACPSMHVATAVFSGFWMHAILRRMQATSVWIHINWIWGVGIVFSTVATRQHVFIDVLAGSALGAVIALISLFKFARKLNTENRQLVGIGFAE